MLTADDPLPMRPRRISVAGVSGSGKTTLAAQIATVTGVPHTEIDGLYHGPNWVPRTEFIDDAMALVAADNWVTEWQYSSARDMIAARAELLVWLDYSFWTVTLPRVVRRTLRRRVHREVLWNGNTEPPLYTFFTDRTHIVRWSYSTRNLYRERIPALAAAQPELTIVRLRHPRETQRWLAGPLAATLDT